MTAYKHTESALIHGGSTVDPLTGAVNIPIYQTSTFQQKGIGLEPEWEYALDVLQSYEDLALPEALDRLTDRIIRNLDHRDHGRENRDRVN